MDYWSALQLEKLVPVPGERNGGELWKLVNVGKTPVNGRSGRAWNDEGSVLCQLEQR